MASTILRIKELCKARGITQYQLAKRLNWYSDNHAVAFSQAIRRNNFTLTKLEQIIDELNKGEKDKFEIVDLFIDRMQEENATQLSCPHCGKPLNITIN